MNATPADTTTPLPEDDKPRGFRLRPWTIVLALLAVAMLILVMLWDWNWFKRPVERMVSERTGREFRIAGDLDVDLGWTSSVRLDRITLGNAPWARNTLMASADRLEFKLELKPLFKRDVRVQEIRLARPVLNLERNKSANNWTFPRDDNGKPAQFRRVWIDAGKLAFLDTPQRTDINVDVSSLVQGDMRAAPPIRAKGGGTFQGNRFTLDGRADSPLNLQDRDSPYRIDVKARAGATRAHARGTLLDPLRMTDFDLKLMLSGSDLADLYPLLGIATPDTPPYQLDGRLTHDDRTWHYDDFSGKVGDSDLAGDAHVTTGGKRPLLRATLVSKRLDFDDLAGFIGGAAQSGGGESTNPKMAARDAKLDSRARVLPDTAFDLEKLNAMDADVRWKARRVNAPGWPIEDMDAHLKIDAGLLRLEPLNFGVAGGDIRSTIRMNAREKVIRTRADITARGLNLAELLPKVKLAQNAVGKVGGRINLDTTGNSIASMFANGDGAIGVGMGRGQISNLLMEMAGIDIAEIIKFKLGKDRQIPIRCAFGDFKVNNGMMSAQSLAFDTSDTILIGSGTVNLRNETLDLVIRPRPKDRSLFALRSPLKLTGTFKQPSFKPDYARVGLRGAIALVLGSIAPPAALLATIELGPGKDAQCGGRYAK